MRTSTRGSKPPSGSARKTTGASRPLALCRFISRTTSRRPGSSGSESTSVDSSGVLVQPRPRGQRVGGLREREAALDDGADAIDRVEEIAGLDAAARRRREREIARVLEDALERGAGRQHRAST